MPKPRDILLARLIAASLPLIVSGVLIALLLAFGANFGLLCWLLAFSGMLVSIRVFRGLQDHHWFEVLGPGHSYDGIL